MDGLAQQPAFIGSTSLMRVERIIVFDSYYPLIGWSPTRVMESRGTRKEQ